MDLKGLSIGQWNKENTDNWQEGIRIMLDHYPDCVESTWVINSPFFFKAMWAIAKGWFDEKKRKEIRFLGDDYLEHLLEICDED